MADGQPRMVFLGFGKYARSDKIFALEPIRGEDRGDVLPGLGLGDGDEPDRSRVAPGPTRGGRDAIANATGSDATDRIANASAEADAWSSQCTSSTTTSSGACSASWNVASDRPVALSTASARVTRCGSGAGGRSWRS